VTSNLKLKGLGLEKVLIK